MANGIDSTTSAAILGAMNATGTFTINTPLRCLWLTAVRASDSGSDTEFSTASGYVQLVGSLFSGQALAFAAPAAGAPSTQASNVAVSVTNMPAGTWAGNRIIDSKATPRSTSADGNTTNTSTTVTSATAAFVAGDVGAVITGTNIPSNTVIASVTNGTTAVLSQAATGTATTTVFTINKLNSPQTTWYASLGSSKTVNLGDTVTVPSGSWTTSLA